MIHFSKKHVRYFLILIFLIFIVFFIFFLRIIPSFNINIINNENNINYLHMSNEIFYRQTLNNCGPYSVMAVINILHGLNIDPEILAQETKWRIRKNLTFPQGVIDLLHKHNITTKEFSMKLYSDNEKITWLKNQIENNNPIILLLKVENIQHYFTIIGYDENGFMIYDSLQEKHKENSRKTIIDREDNIGNRYYSNDKLIKLWNKGGYKIFFRNWAIVCY